MRSQKLIRRLAALRVRRSPELKEALEISDKKEVKLMALKDPDLEPLGKEIGKL